MRRFQNRIKVAHYRRIQVNNPLDVVANHFSYWSSIDHINRRAFEIVIGELKGAPANIIETGTSAWGTDSTRLWDSYVTNFGGMFRTVDIRPEPAERLKGQTGKSTQLVVSDSVNFLTNDIGDENVDVFFLDSRDVDWLTPLDSAKHGLMEYKAIRNKLTGGAILFVDDTPISQDWMPQEWKSIEQIESAKKFEIEHGVFPGKGALILKEIARLPNIEILYHEYSVVIKFP